MAVHAGRMPTQVRNGLQRMVCCCCCSLAMSREAQGRLSQLAAGQCPSWLRIHSYLSPDVSALLASSWALALYIQQHGERGTAARRHQQLRSTNHVSKQPPLASLQLITASAVLCCVAGCRLAPLSEGRIEADGTLQCSYHGWRFDSSGRCTDIPQVRRSQRWREPTPAIDCSSRAPQQHRQVHRHPTDDGAH